MLSPFAFLIRFSIVMVIVLAIDFYVFKGIKAALSGFTSAKLKQVVYWVYWIVNISFVALAYYAILTWNKAENPRTTLFVILGSAFVLLFVPKLVFSLFLLAEDVYRVLRGSIVSSTKLFFVKNNQMEIPAWIGRRKFISQLGMAAAAVPFLSIIYGLAKGKYNYKVHRINVSFNDLPEAFDGFTITQISDIHAGSFDSVEDVKRGIKMINEQQSDAIFFTGDLVNNFANEMEPWIPLFESLKAPHGKYSITGNHDYGDYVVWDSPEKKKQNFEELKKVHEKIGFNLLLNQHTFIERDGQRIAIMGLENWGKGNFSKYGNLSDTLNGLEDNDFKILLSHDPSHWEAEVYNHEKHIHLSLAGHTHGMQFGVEIPGIKWSPVKYRYPQWAGLYGETNKYLYVNRGFGFIGFPGRVGIWPEVTVITLNRA